MSWGRFDIGAEGLERALAHSPSPDLLRALVDLSRRHFGWFSMTPTRAFEGPWIIRQIELRSARRILDIGAGISPVPVFLAEWGAEVLTVDCSPRIRRARGNRRNWNDWGFLDYASLHPNLSSLHQDILSVSLPGRSFDCVYSLSVIEHMPSAARKQLWRKVEGWLADEGILLVTVDLFPDSDRLWNYSQGEEVEAAEEHGSLPMLEQELSRVGFQLVERQTVRGLKGSRTDCAMLRFERLKGSPDHVQVQHELGDDDASR